MKKAFVTGITGQDGSYLAELLLAKGYEVHGLIRRSSSINTGRIDHLYQDRHDPSARLFLHYGDLSDASALARLLAQIGPDEVYALGAQSHVRVSFDAPLYTADVTGLGALRLLEAIRESKVPCRFYQASSSEMFGAAPAPQNEKTPFYPRSPYGVAKVSAYWYAVNYREAYGLHISNGILFNHESPRRGDTFVTKKITKGIARIMAKKDSTIYLGNLDAKRDWGYAAEFVDAMWRMVQQDEPGDYVVATGETHTVREFVDIASKLVGLNPEEIVRIDPKYYRPTEVDVLLGDYSKAKEKLDWAPKSSFTDLVKLMLAADLEEEKIPVPFDIPVDPLDWRAGRPR
ncbi:GDP-mannose 4,6-dehydratase [Patescibacteria group bacterium]|nr:GDP-mannose 4,6-dehydratase [Patescibacteria group bacterium]